MLFSEPNRIYECMWKRLKQIKSGASPRWNQEKPAWPPQPIEPFLAIGDIHGRADLLSDIDRQIEAQCPDWPVVFLGDYIDRGNQSREVLEILMSVSEDDTPPVRCLMGNHERMLLDALDDPERAVPRWLRNGGLQLLASFGVSPPRGNSTDPAPLYDMRDALMTAMGDEMIAWLRARPLMWQNGNVWALHAGADPHNPLSEQAANVLLWGHPEFLHSPRQDGQWIVHGHTIVDNPHAADGRIAVDTGAYATGRLSAALITEEGVRFFQTGSDR
ncbi:metallophosphoesterase [Roseovarius tibetensis]|uniref:metallophosphoesterase n=1 Tax=Roseovarius tibetensis TaxID=2685897 RepID=UPI003D7F9DB8